ncbi:hypothetical protein E2C01_096300 [Portunus trituberculatus]|uniref:Uncharacterized protein n=1 Tax=Portunus trituberculatus TaxID=210409 RepID=A0A5B7K1D4_PORTR|nr:hypothetical protein [Portunus trituberculatus]
MAGEARSKCCHPGHRHTPPCPPSPRHYPISESGQSAPHLQLEISSKKGFDVRFTDGWGASTPT